MTDPETRGSARSPMLGHPDRERGGTRRWPETPMGRGFASNPARTRIPAIPLNKTPPQFAVAFEAPRLGFEPRTYLLTGSRPPERPVEGTQMFFGRPGPAYIGRRFNRSGLIGRAAQPRATFSHRPNNIIPLIGLRDRQIRDRGATHNTDTRKPAVRAAALPQHHLTSS